MEIMPSARKHGVRDDDMLHAVSMHVGVFDQGGDVRMYVGPTRSGHVLLEVAVLMNRERERIIHAMAARPKFLR